MTVNKNSPGKLARTFGVLLVLVLIAAFLALAAFPLWYLIVIAHAPNWAAASYVFLAIGLGANRASSK